MALTNHILPDSPTNNFAALNVLNKDSDLTISNGNLEVTSSTSGSHSNVLGNILADGNNKFYIELTFSVALSGTTAFAFYLADPSFTVINTHPVSSSSGAWGWYGSTGGNLIANGAPIASVTSPTTNSILQLVYNSSTGDGWVGFNDVYFDSSGGTTGSPNTNQNPTFTNLPNNLTIGVDVIGSQILKLNFGQDPTFGGAKSPTTTYTDANGIGAFYYQPPTGALALCTANLSDFTPTVAGDTPQDYFKAVLYTGAYPNANSVNVGFNPDLIWLKSRTQTYSHGVLDTIRRVNGYEYLATNNANAQPTGGDLISFISNGFSVDTGQTFNDAGTGDNNMVAWCWKAGGAPTADNSNTSGAMTANSVSLNGTLQSNYTPAGSPTIYPKRMSINTDAGFSIVKYVGDEGTGSTVPHGLLEAPQIVIVKPLNGAVVFGWRVYTEMTGNTKYLLLNAPDQASTYTDWNSTSPTSNVFTVNSSSAQTNNQDGTDYIAYCWHSVEGYSKFGNYQPEQNVPFFVYLGFRPAFLMVKGQTYASSWYIFDNERNEFNTTGKTLSPNGAGTEQDFYNGGVDFVSNGFVIRGRSDTGIPSSSPANVGSSHKLIYMAFAEQPFKFSNAR